MPPAAEKHALTDAHGIGRHENAAAAPTASSAELAAFAAERRRETLLRLRHTAYAVLAGATAGLVTVNFLPLPGHRTAAVTAFACMVVLAGGVLALAQGERAEPYATSCAVAFVSGVGVSLCWFLSLLPSDVDVLAGLVGTTMIATALVLPWGGTAQAIVSLSWALGYLSLLPWFDFKSARLLTVLLVLGNSAVLSILGAAGLDHQRRATFLEREQARQLAGQRALLLDAGRELNETLAVPDLLARIARLARELFTCELGALVLLDEGEGILRVAAADGARPEVVGLEVPEANRTHILEGLARMRLWLSEDESEAQDSWRRWQHRLGIAPHLCVPMEHDGLLLGYLSFHRRAGAPPFGEAQIPLAEGLAHQAAIALANARLVDALQTANRAKSEFVSTMSHELRTPLNVIMGYTEMLDDPQYTDRELALERIRRANVELLELIEQTLNLNRLESGQDETHFEPIALRGLWDELASEYAALPDRPSVRLRWEPVDGIGFVTDRRKLKMILKNLVGNALKFTPAGEVVVGCTADETQAALSVRDTGVGIAPEHLPVIFEMFRQVDSSDRRAYGGVGLGLHIVRRYVEQLGGTVRVESEPGQGSTFTVTLPIGGVAGRRAA